MFKILIALIFLTFNTFAESTSTASLAPKKTNSFSDRFSLEFVLSAEQTKDSESKEVNGLYSTLKNSLLFRASKNDEVRLYASHVWERYDKNIRNMSYWELAETMYRRKNILNQKDHFISMNLELKNYWVMDDDIKKLWGFDGAFIPQAIFKKSFGRKAGLKLKVRRHYFDRNRSTAGTLTKEDRIYFSGSYMFTRRFMFNAEMKYRHKIYTGDHFSYRKFAMEKENVEITTIHPSLLFFVNRKTMIEAYVETVINNSTDERNTSNLMKDEQVFGAALYLAAF
jgi:hypothetical protein